MSQILPEPGSLDDALSRLDSESTTDQRLALIGQLVEFWEGPLRISDGYTEDDLNGKALPIPLRRWFRLAGRRQELMSGQNFLIEPDKLKIDQDGRLVFYVENQGVYLWSTTSQGDDPLVEGRFNDTNTWEEEGMPLSEFLIGAFLFQAIMQAPFGAALGWAEPKTLDRLAKTIPPLPLVPWRWPSYPSRFYARKGAFMFAAANNDNQGNKAFSIWIGAKTGEPLAILKEIVDDTWDHVAL